MNYLVKTSPMHLNKMTLLTDKRYLIDKENFSDYLSDTYEYELNKVIVIYFVVTVLEIITALVVKHDFPIWILVISTIIVFAVLFFRQRLWDSTLNKFKEAKYDLSETSISMVSDELPVRTFHYKDIAVIHSSKKGTTLVKGSPWAKLNYLIPKLRKTSIDRDDRIFIPKATMEYTELVSLVKKHSVNALKI